MHSLSRMAEPTAADVQEELQDYLNSKNINALFIQVSLYLPISTVIKFPLMNETAHLTSWCIHSNMPFSWCIGQIVERLLIEKPDNPIGFIVEYLQKTYPDQTSAAAHKAAAASERYERS